ncbi:MAG: hypothetical protein WCO35_03415 [Candidatus Nomurabacteria bacterium]
MKFGESFNNKKQTVEKELNGYIKELESLNNIKDEILLYKKAGKEFGFDSKIVNEMKTYIIKKYKNSVEDLNEIYWTTGGFLRNEAEQYLVNLGHLDDCKCEICGAYLNKNSSSLINGIEKTFSAKNMSGRLGFRFLNKDENKKESADSQTQQIEKIENLDKNDDIGKAA